MASLGLVVVHRNPRGKLTRICCFSSGFRIIVMRHDSFVVGQLNILFTSFVTTIKGKRTSKYKRAVSPVNKNGQQRVTGVKKSVDRLRFTFTPNGKREFVPRDQVLPLIVVNCLLPQLKSKQLHASFIHKNCSGQFLSDYFLF